MNQVTGSTSVPIHQTMLTYLVVVNVMSFGPPSLFLVGTFLHIFRLFFPVRSSFLGGFKTFPFSCSFTFFNGPCRLFFIASAFAYQSQVTTTQAETPGDDARRRHEFRPIKYKSHCTSWGPPQACTRARPLLFIVTNLSANPSCQCVYI